MITVKRDGAVGVITLDRHAKRNALDVDHLDQLDIAVTECVAGGSRALVITGAGTSFCSGADLTGVYGEGFRASLYRALRNISHAAVPVIAAINGPAIGAGTQLAIACDLRIAVPEARFSVPTARNGLAVDPWTIRRLTAMAGGATARALLLACATLDPELALARGLIDRVGTLNEALALAHDITEMSTMSLAYSKKALIALFEQSSWDQTLDDEFDACWVAADRARAESRTT